MQQEVALILGIMPLDHNIMGVMPEWRQNLGTISEVQQATIATETMGITPSELMKIRTGSGW